MSLWCEGFPVVDIPQGNDPKPFTLVLPYYENPQFLRTQLGWWGTYPEHVREQMDVIVVDDGSPNYPASGILAGHPQPVHIHLFRIEVDVRWNWLAARNIGAHHAADQWLLAE